MLLSRDALAGPLTACDSVPQKNESRPGDSQVSRVTWSGSPSSAVSPGYAAFVSSVFAIRPPPTVERMSAESIVIKVLSGSLAGVLFRSGFDRGDAAGGRPPASLRRLRHGSEPPTIVDDSLASDAAAGS